MHVPDESHQNSSRQDIEHKQIKCLSSGKEIQVYDIEIRKITSHQKV